MRHATRSEAWVVNVGTGMERKRAVAHAASSGRQRW